MKSKVAKAIFLGAFVALTFLSFAPSPANAGSDTMMNWSSLSVGEIVAQGAQTQTGNNTSCYFSDVSLNTQSRVGINRTIDLRVDNQCQLYVHAKSERPVRPASADPTGVDYTWMYGFGGVNDKLTSITTNLAFTYGCGGVCISSASLVCSWKNDGWRNYECVIDSVTFTGSSPGSHTHGIFSWICNPGCLYGHSLWQYEYLFPAGFINCYYGFTGHIPSGISNQCYERA